MEPRWRLVKAYSGRVGRRCRYISSLISPALTAWRLRSDAGVPEARSAAEMSSLRPHSPNGVVDCEAASGSSERHSAPPMAPAVLSVEGLLAAAGESPDALEPNRLRPAGTGGVAFGVSHPVGASPQAPRGLALSSSCGASSRLVEHELWTERGGARDVRGARGGGAVR